VPSDEDHLVPEVLQRMVGVLDTEEAPDHAVPDVHEIVEAIHDHRVPGAAPLRLELDHPELERPGRGKAVLPNVLDRAVDELGVVEHEELRVEDVRLDLSQTCLRAVPNLPDP